MAQSEGVFPFGQKIRRVVQADRSPKRVFILGVYASAVHARWINPEGKQVVKALGVASEPYIFWQGKRAEAEEVISEIEVPVEAGCLVPASKALNGPSGRSLDDDFLAPLGLSRNEAWLCDIVPRSCMNQGQAQAIRERYEPEAKRLGLPSVAWSPVPTVLADDARRREITEELRESRAEVIVTLGDLPLKWFGAAFGTCPSLGDYSKDSKPYGILHDIEIGRRSMKLLPLVHPRQAAGLGFHSPEWAKRHRTWVRERAPRLLQ